MKLLNILVIKGNFSGKLNIAAIRVLGFKKYGTFVQLIIVLTLLVRTKWIEDISPHVSYAEGFARGVLLNGCLLLDILATF